MMPEFQFPNFNLPQFPFQNLPQQLGASFGMPQLGGQYARFSGGQPPQSIGQLPQLPGGNMPQAGTGTTFQQSSGGLGQIPNGGGSGMFGGLATGLGGLNNMMGGGFGAGQGSMFGGGSAPPGMDQANFGASPPMSNGGSTQGFRTSFAGPPPGQGTAFGNTVRNNLGAYGAAGQAYANMPKTFSPAQFNSVAQKDPVLGEQMLAAMGQQGRNAVMQSNGWSNPQMNSFINQYGSGALPGFGSQQMSLLRSLGAA